MTRTLSLLFILIAASVGFWHISQQPAWSEFQVPMIIPNKTTTPIQSTTPGMTSEFLPGITAATVHAASLISLHDGNVMAFWFAGSREGANDVVIQSAIFDNKNNTWHEPKIVIDRITTQRGLWRYISKLGNPVPIRTQDGKLQLLFVTASIGGWSTSSITAITSDDEGITWDHPQRLITSPFLNLGTLVKSPAFNFADGSMGLPVYHEFLAKFGELLRVDSIANAIQLMDMRRMSSGRGTLQPIIFMDDGHKAVAYFRQARGSTEPNRIPTSNTIDAGQTWQIGNDLSLPNPNAAIAGLTLSNGDRLLVLNDLEHGRYRLVLAIAQLLDKDANYSAWNIIKVLEDESMLLEKQRKSFAYPYLLADNSGNVHLIYSWDKTKIKHIRFTETYLHQLSALTEKVTP